MRGRTPKRGQALRPEDPESEDPEPEDPEPEDTAPEDGDVLPRRSLVPAGCDWPIVLGFDPGTLVAGYGAVVVAPDGPRVLLCGVIRAPKNLGVPARLALIRRVAEEVLVACRPTVVVVESVFAARNVRSALRIGEGRGVILACAASFGAEVVECSPASAKKAVVGNGQASKAQVAAMVRAQVASADFDLPLDATDALALALYQVKKIGFATAVARGRQR